MELLAGLFQNCGKKDWQAGALWLGWVVIGGLLPLWGTAVLLGLFGKSVDSHELLKNGEFVLYAASFSGATLYVIRRDIFPSRNLLTIAHCAVLAICLLVFTALTVTSMLAGQAMQQPAQAVHTIAPGALFGWSIAMLVLSCLLGFLVTVADAAQLGFDLKDQAKKDLKQLNSDFDKTN